MKKIVSLGFLAVASVVLLTGCGKNNKNNGVIETGDKITITYTATTNEKNPEIIEKNIRKIIEIGKGEIFNVFDEKLLGKEVENNITIILKGEKIYKNKISEGNIQKIPLVVFSNTNTKVNIGKKVTIENKEGIVTKIQDGYVTIDMNPTYLDKDITFDIVIKEIEKKGKFN